MLARAHFGKTGFFLTSSDFVVKGSFVFACGSAALCFVVFSGLLIR